MNRSAQDIANQSFSLVRKGYDPVAVRAYLSELAEEVTDPGSEAAVAQAAKLLADAEADVASRRSAFEADLAAAQRRLAELQQAEADLTTRMTEAERDHEARLAQRDLEATARQEEAEQRAAALIEAARAEAEAAYQDRWQDAGGMVTRILEAAEAEAKTLTDRAESVALEIRSNLQVEVEHTRAEAERHAAEVRDRAEEAANAQLAAAESERVQAAETLAAAKAEAERVEADAAARASDSLRRAEEAVRAHVTEQLTAAQGDLQGLRQDEIEVTARLSQVQELLKDVLLIAGEKEEHVIAEPDAFLLQLAGAGDQEGSAPGRVTAPRARRTPPSRPPDGPEGGAEPSAASTRRTHAAGVARSRAERPNGGRC